MIYLTFLSLFVAISIITYNIVRFKEIPNSISSMVHTFPKGWLWTIWIWFLAISVCASMMSIIPNAYSFIPFIMVMSLVITGSMPLFLEEQEKIHSIFGIISGISSQLCVLLINPYCLYVWILGMSLIGAYKEKRVFFAEITCLLATYLSLLL